LKFSKSTRYALYAVIEMATANGPVSVAQICKRFDIPEGALARVFQGLVRARIAHGTRGAGGGYRLVRPAGEITVLDVISVFEPPRMMGSCLLADDGETNCHEEPDCRLRKLFDEVDELARNTFASVTIETLLR